MILTSANSKCSDHFTLCTVRSQPLLFARNICGPREAYKHKIEAVDRLSGFTNCLNFFLFEDILWDLISLRRPSIFERAQQILDRFKTYSLNCRSCGPAVSDVHLVVLNIFIPYTVQTQLPHIAHDKSPIFSENGQELSMYFTEYCLCLMADRRQRRI